LGNVGKFAVVYVALLCYNTSEGFEMFPFFRAVRKEGIFMTITATGTIIVVLFLLLLAISSLLLGAYIMTRRDLRRTKFKIEIPKIYKLELETENDEKCKKKG